MEKMKLTFGLLFLGGAWLVLFKSQILFKFNAWMREVVFSDHLILFSGRRLAILLLVLGGLSLFSGLEDFTQFEAIKPEVAAQILDQANDDFKKGRHIRVINWCQVLVRSNPKNIQAWELLANSWWAVGKKSKSYNAIQTLLLLDPDNHLGLKLREKYLQNKETGTK